MRQGGRNVRLDLCCNLYGWVYLWGNIRILCSKATKLMTKQDAGKRGGTATFRKYGRKYMSELGKRGAKVFHSKYKICPVGQSDYAIVCRKTNTIINFLGGRFYLQ